MGLDVETSKTAPTLGSKYKPGKQDSAGGQMMRTEAAYRSAVGTLLYHALDRPDIQFSMCRFVSGLSCPKADHLALLKHIAWYLVDMRVEAPSLSWGLPLVLIWW